MSHHGSPAPTAALIRSDDNDHTQAPEGLWIYGGNNGDWYLTTGHIIHADRVPMAATCRVRTSGSAQRPNVDMAVALLYHVAQGNTERALSIAQALTRLLSDPPRWSDGTPL